MYKVIVPPFAATQSIHADSPRQAASAASCDLVPGQEVLVYSPPDGVWLSFEVGTEPEEVRGRGKVEYVAP